MLAGRPAIAGEDLAEVRECRDARSTIDLVDSTRVLSADKAEALEGEIQHTYIRLAPSVVRIWRHDNHGQAFDEHGQPSVGGSSGVIIDRKGLILTCSHHRLAPGTAVTIELADGERAPGRALGRFQIDGLLSGLGGPDLGLTRINEVETVLQRRGAMTQQQSPGRSAGNRFSPDASSRPASASACVPSDGLESPYVLSRVVRCIKANDNQQPRHTLRRECRLRRVAQFQSIPPTWRGSIAKG